VNKDKSETSLGFTDGTEREITVALPSTGKYTVFVRAVVMQDEVLINQSLGAKVVVKKV
jgi:hypothetical protein